MGTEALRLRPSAMLCYAIIAEAFLIQFNTNIYA